ncbi:MAG: hypothetical protein WCS66_03940, partial [Bacteroidales bacterium]
MNSKKSTISFILAVVLFVGTVSAAKSIRTTYNFNSSWLLYVGDIPAAREIEFDDSEWKTVNLPAAFNEDEAFAKSIHELTDTVVWYRKHFKIP